MRINIRKHPSFFEVTNDKRPRGVNQEYPYCRVRITNRDGNTVYAAGEVIPEDFEHSLEHFMVRKPCTDTVVDIMFKTTKQDPWAEDFLVIKGEALDCDAVVEVIRRPEDHDVRSMIFTTEVMKEGNIVAIKSVRTQNY